MTHLPFLRTLTCTLCLLFPSIHLPAAETAENDAPVVTPAKPKSDLDVIAGWVQFRAAPDALYYHLNSEALSLLAKRDQQVGKIISKDDWRRQQEKVRHTLADIVGPFPERTPLNARIVSTVEKTGYRIENIVFESQPGFYVTAALFLPRNLSGAAPTVLYASGHALSGYRSGYIPTILNLVKKGFVVFAWDPISQGERFQYLGDTGKPLIGGNNAEHAYITQQAMLTGSSLARLVIWDGIRAVDYLLTRPEVDPRRLGITGRSGGGFQSLYIPAFDDRIYATAPENHVCNNTRILQKIGPRDGEQNLFHMFARGIDHPDLLTARAPNPTLIIATTNDLFNIEGTRETFREVSRAYKAMGAPDNLKLIEDDAGHQSTTRNNETMYAFFQKQLGNPGSPATEKVEMPTKEELRVTPTGQVYTWLKGNTVSALSRREADRLVAHRQAEIAATGFKPSEIVAAAIRESGYLPPNPADRPVLTGRSHRSGYVVERYFVKGEGDYPIPYVAMLPEHPNGRAVLYLHPRGKAADGGKGGKMERLVRLGYKVIAPDLIGTGEVGPGISSGERHYGQMVNSGVNYKTWYLGMFIGRSVLAVRAGDVVKLAAILKGDGVTEISAVAFGAIGPVLLHAAAISRDISRIALVDSLSSYHSAAATELYAPSFIEAFVPGALRSYDLPLLAASLAPRRTILHNTVDGAAKTLPADIVKQEYAPASAAFSSVNAKDNFVVSTGDDPQAPLTRLLGD
ncbi:MAG: acetylxylan esterase [Opitutaceae bacterium]|nr:acetylxylan esterase [Opitutaceae bacterium]